jgi:histidinol-phosphate aminotransferase
MSSLITIKPGVRKLSPYSLKAAKARIKLNQNENPWGAPAEIKHEVQRRIADLSWSRYPDFVSDRLHQRLADHSGWRADGIVAGNGSNELIQAVFMVTLGEGKRVLINEPTFALYKQLGTVLGAEVITVPLTTSLTYDLIAMRQAIKDSEPELVVICSPNNPTGCVLPHHDLSSLLAATRGLVVVDEAYFEFSNQSALSILKEHANLVVLRTFSKAMALAGLRVGYLLAAPELVTEIAKAVLPYNLNVVSQTAAEVSLEMYEDHLVPLIQRICAERDRLFVELNRIPGLSPVASRANFMVVRSAVPAARVWEELLHREILIRDVSGYPLLRDYFRLCVGTSDENDELIKALREIFIAPGS